MSLRTRLIIFVLLFGSAVLTNIFALIYLARSISASLAAIENIQQRQLLVAQMNVHLRDAEAALYRYQINGETGFTFQFVEQMNEFWKNLEQYRQLASEPNEQQWAATLKLSHQQAVNAGNDLIDLHEKQRSRLDEFLNTQAKLSAFLSTDVMTSRSDDPAYHAIVADMQDSSRAMLSAVTGYLASPEETKRVQFTDAVVSFQQAANNFRDIAQSDDEQRWVREILTTFNQLKVLGTQLIGGRDLQQSLYAKFISIIFNAGEQTIAERIQPYETEKFSREQTALLKAVTTASAASILVAAMISALAILFMFQLSRQINTRAGALLDGAERVAAGRLDEPVNVSGGDEFGRLADSFNEMMVKLASREERLRALISRMAQIQDEERRLIGLDLHDGLTQIIISANMHLNTVKALAALKPEAEQELDLSRSLVKQAIDEARKVISELRPSLVDDFGLEEGLRRYVNDVCETEKWECDLDVSAEVQVAAPVDAAIFRIAQEALTNVRKHARTRKIYVGLKVEQQNLVLRVQDWGLGFDPSAFHNESEHLGLFSMQERAELLGGQCVIESQLGQGTTVEVRVPLSVLMERGK